MLFEGPVELAEAGEAAARRDLLHAHAALGQQPAGFVHRGLHENFFGSFTALLEKQPVIQDRMRTRAAELDKAPAKGQNACRKEADPRLGST